MVLFNLQNITRFNANIDHVTRFGREFSIIKIPYSFKLLMQELGTMNIQMRIITEDNIDQLENMSFSDNFNKLMMFNSDEKTVNDPDLFKQDIVKLAVENKNNVVNADDKLPDVAYKTPDDDLEIDYTQLPDYNEQHTLNINFKKGDMVKHNKDTKQSRLWKIGFIEDDENIALITEDVDDIPDSIEILEKKDNRVVVHATKKDIYFDMSPQFVPQTPDSPYSPPYAPGSPPYAPGSPPYAPGTPSSYDPNSPPYSAILGRVMTEDEYNKSIIRSPSESPPYSAVTPPSNNSPGYPSVENQNISVNNTNYQPGAPIMITPMVPTQKLSETKSEELDLINEKSPEKKVTYSTIIEKNNLEPNTPILSTIEEEKEKEKKEEQLKSVNL